jgi:hypothetical protein
VGCPLGWTMQTACCLTTRITTRLAAELRGWRPLGCAQIAVSFARRLLEHCVKIAPAKAADLSASHVEDRSPAHALTISGRKYIHKCYTIHNKLLTPDNAAYV